jgi:hypothetical protein
MEPNKTRKHLQYKQSVINKTEYNLKYNKYVLM